MINPIVVIPIYNHPETIEQLVDQITEMEYPCFIVDDGSDEKTRTIVEHIAGENGLVQAFHRQQNGGKGRAVYDGLKWSREHGYTHAVLIDADLQHDPRDIPRFVERARNAPNSLIIGKPEFDETIPPARRYGRILSQVWVWIETLSTDIHDPLCGYRCYPIKRTLKIMDREHVGCRMEFDAELAVRFQWNGGKVVNLETPVRYYPDMVSHFRMFVDNIRISWMHFRLFFGMIFRAPRFIMSKVSADE